MLGDVVAVALLGLLALGGALLLRDRSPGSWPRSLTVLLPLAAVVAVLVALTDAATHLWRGLGPGEWWLPAVLVVAAATILLLIRRGGASWVAASWLAGAVLLIGLTILPSGEDGPHLAADPARQLRSCLLTGHRLPFLGLSEPGRAVASAGQPTVLALLVERADRWARVTTSLLPALDGHKLTTEQLPNVALFVPLGIAIAAVARRRTGWWIALGVGLSVGVESYQAVLTSRTCSTVDVATNAIGLLVGWAVHDVGKRLATRLAPPPAAGR